MNLIENHLPEFVKVIEHFKSEASKLKTGRANPAILDGVMISAYGVLTPINQLASVSVPEARSIVIQPWDKNILKDIERGILEANLGLSPVNEGERIRVVVPQMTEESRKEIVKILNHKAEEARIGVRNVREKIKEAVLEAEKNKEFGEDERFGLIEDLDKKTGEFNEQIKRIADEKEEEIMTV